MRPQSLSLLIGLVLSPVFGAGQNAGPPGGLRLVEVARVGASEGDSRLEFGLIKDVAAGNRGIFAVLDARQRAVRIFSSQGGLLQILGRGGRGPGEYFAPVALAFDRSQNLYVLDPGNQKVEIYHRSGENFVLRDAFRIDFPADDLCVIGDVLYVHGYRNGRVVHAFTPAGTWVRSFGAPLSMRSEYMRRAYSRARIECIEEEATVLILPHLSPVVRAYFADGRPRWRSLLADYEPVLISETRRGATYRTGRSGTHHMASSIVGVDPGHAILQIGVIGPNARNSEEFGSVTSYLLDVASGRLRPMSASTPRLLSASSGIAYAVVNDPYPQVTAYRATWQ